MKKTAVAATPKQPRVAKAKPEEAPEDITPAIKASVMVKRPVAIAAVLKKYNEGGWVASLAPKGSINDIIAQKPGKYHFIQVIWQDPDVRTEDATKNTFIQNAFANGAIPVHATMSGADCKISLYDVNLNTRCIVGAAAPKTTAEPKSRAKNL